MGLTEESLNFHKEMEKYKDVLSRESKLYEKTELQKSQLKE
jgi:hypothetical protein